MHTSSQPSPAAGPRGTHLPASPCRFLSNDWLRPTQASLCTYPSTPSAPPALREPAHGRAGPSATWAGPCWPAGVGGKAHRPHAQARRLTRAHTFPGTQAHTLSQELIQNTPALERRKPARSLCPACVWLRGPEHSLERTEPQGRAGVNTGAVGHVPSTLQPTAPQSLLESRRWRAPWLGEAKDKR